MSLSRSPNWRVFFVALLNNAAYQRVSNATTSDRAVSRLELLIATETDNWPLISMLWQLMIGGVPQLWLPQPEEIGKWQAITVATHMPITFDENGLIQWL